MTRRAQVAADWRARLSAAGLGDLTVLLGESPGMSGLPGGLEALHKPGLVGRERWRWQLDGGHAVLYLKRYCAPPLGAQLDRIRRQTAWHSRGWWEYQQSQTLARHAVPAVRAVGVVEDMRAAWEKSSAVLCERAPGDALDRVWLTLTAGRAPLTQGAARHDLTRRLARFVSAFHQTGLCHRDLYLCHIFLELPVRPAQPPRFTLIDLARTHRPRWRRTRWLIKDLAQLDCSARQVGASRADRWRFLLTYLGLQAGAPRARWYARHVARKSDGILWRTERKRRAAGAGC